MNFKIREANELDIDHIFQFIINKAEFDRNLGDSLGLVTTNKEIIRKTRFNDLYVEQIDRGFGLGKNLMNSLLTIAKEMNASDISWIASDFNEGAKEFYHKIGSKQIQKMVLPLPTNYL
ncbi:GNAT family N-acetyltransferase [Leptospira limi]|uniref:GNAT family N-acetyltransferase n=1 Tax=Leptospira limi TaxID=2950023 RepID=A0ABT3LT73_9LEPT|nr:GNAT family N-acetyltransferase [Leptospira limi]MCW7460936.1 GNAT family N-acetyltransferase [Leptospira limi]